MDTPQKKISYRDGDHASTPLLLLLFLGIAIGLHLLFALCLHSAPEDQKTTKEQHRTIRMIASQNININSPGYQLADPTIFVHGAGDVGYSQMELEIDQKNPALSTAAEPLVLSVREELHPQEITAPERHDLPHLSANAPLLGAPVKATPQRQATVSPVIYPVWLDLSGKTLNHFFTSQQIAGLRVLNIRGQTLFRIKPGANKDLQYHVILIQSCGKPSADLAAKAVLEKALTAPAFCKIVPGKEGLTVRLCWSQLAATPRQQSQPDKMFPDESDKMEVKQQ